MIARLSDTQLSLQLIFLFNSLVHAILDRSHCIIPVTFALVIWCVLFYLHFCFLCWQLLLHNDCDRPVTNIFLQGASLSQW